jgi:hypothetical protein
MDKDEIDELIKEASGRKLEILIQLKTLNQQAFFHMKTPKKSWKQNYKEMWSKSFWKEARILLKEYFTNKNGILKCPLCNKLLYDKFVLHHFPKFYKGSFKANMFTPLYTQLICNSCNYKVHKK